MRVSIFRNFGTEGALASRWRRCSGDWWPGSARPSARCECRSSTATFPISSSCSASRSAWSTSALRGSSGALGAAARHRPGRGDRPATALARAGGCSTCCPTTSSVPTGVKVLQVSPSTLSLTFETSAVADGPRRARHRRRAGAGVRRGARHRRSGDRRRVGPVVSREQRHRSDDRAGERHGAPPSPVIDTVTDRRARLDRAPAQLAQTRS